MEKDNITKQAHILKQRQEEKQDASVLPTLRVSGIFFNYLFIVIYFLMGKNTYPKRKKKQIYKTTILKEYQFSG